MITNNCSLWKVPHRVPSSCHVFVGVPEAPLIPLSTAFNGLHCCFGVFMMLLR